MDPRYPYPGRYSPPPPPRPMRRASPERRYTPSRQRSPYDRHRGSPPRADYRYSAPRADYVFRDSHYDHGPAYSRYRETNDYDVPPRCEHTSPRDDLGRSSRSSHPVEYSYHDAGYHVSLHGSDESRRRTPPASYRSTNHRRYPARDDTVVHQAHSHFHANNAAQKSSEPSRERRRPRGGESNDSFDNRMSNTQDVDPRRLLQEIEAMKRDSLSKDEIIDSTKKSLAEAENRKNHYKNESSQADCKITALKEQIAVLQRRNDELDAISKALSDRLQPVNINASLSEGGDRCSDTVPSIEHESDVLQSEVSDDHASDVSDLRAAHKASSSRVISISRANAETLRSLIRPDDEELRQLFSRYPSWRLVLLPGQSSQDDLWLREQYARMSRGEAPQTAQQRSFFRIAGALTVQLVDVVDYVTARPEADGAGGSHYAAEGLKESEEDSGFGRRGRQ